ncbi:MAG: hypothetical protein JW717_09810 [Marinilabiliaceae bacterium]|nr:hypothetical protein [Marinilabiliaceae bacterium]
MKRLLLLGISFVAIISTALSGEMVLKGTFQGENLYVKNPFASSGVGFCIYEVTVNGLTTTDEINSSAFEIDLSVYNFAIGENVIVNIRYKEDCLPKVLNPEVLYSRATFKIDQMKVEGNKLKWTASNESGKLPYIVEQFRWNKWIRVGEVEGLGTQGSNSYSTTVRLHAGDNRFRIKQVDFKNQARYSKEIGTLSVTPEITFEPKRVDDIITFSGPTMYEIYDEYGGIVFKGYGESVKVSGIQKGKYYINYDNKMDQFTKK